MINFESTITGGNVKLAEFLESLEAKVSSQIKYSINVKDYGAVGDGVTNDTTAISTAITALGTAIYTYGFAQLTFPQGTFMTDGTIVSGLSNFSITGPGTLKLNRARVGNTSVNTNDVLDLVACTDFTVKGLGVDGNRHTDVSWPTTDRAPVTQYLTSTANSGQKNVVVSNASLFVVGEKVWVCGGLTANGGADHDKVDNNNQQGLAIDSINTGTNTLTLHSNLSNTYTATGVSGGSYVTTYQTGYQRTVGSYLLGNEDCQNGIHLLGCTRFSITDCFCHDFWESPIKLGIGFDSNANNLASGCSYGIISGNRCTRGYDQGVSVWNSRSISVQNNQCFDCGWGGCVFTGTDDSTATSNILRDNYYRIPGDNSSGYGFVIEGGSRNLAAENQITANYNAGVLLSPSPLTFGVSGTTLNGNLSWGSTAIPVVSGAGFLVGASYMINDGSKSESFVVQSVVVNTVTATKKTRFYHASGKAVAKRTAEDNTIENNLVTDSVNSYGMWISPAVRCNLRNNTVERNYNKGILVENSNGFTSGGMILDGNYFTGNGNGTGAQAILADSVPDIQIINNRVSGNFGDKGIQCKGITNSRVVGNSVTDVQSEGIYFENGSVQCSKVTVTNNDVKQCDGAGIKIDRGNHFTICDNNCWANAGDGGISLGGLTHSTVKGNVAVANNGNGILLQDNNSVDCTWNFIEGNIVRDDGSGIKGSDGSALTQGVAIKEQNNGNNNRILNNQVDIASSKVGASTTIVGDLIN